MYFVNHTADMWDNYQCCLFEKVSVHVLVFCVLCEVCEVMCPQGLAAVPPDWMKNCQYNGTQKIGVSGTHILVSHDCHVTMLQDTEVDVWWFPGTSDPEKPCYGYWDTLDDQHTPVQFFGLSSVGPTILQYHQYKPNSLSPGKSLLTSLQYSLYVIKCVLYVEQEQVYYYRNRVAFQSQVVGLYKYYY